MANQTIVVANHDAVYLEMIKDILEYAGYEQVICIINPPVEDVARVNPALILLDIHFGNKDTDWRLVDQCKLHRTLQHVPMIVCATDARLFAAKAEMLTAQAITTLEKPFHIEKLLETVAARIGPPTKG